MLQQIIIIDAGGVTLFSWTPRDLPSDPTLISGFLTALNLFAVHERGENIRRIHLDPTTFIFERTDNLLFVLLTSDEKFEKIYERILVEVKNQFIAKYRVEITQFDGNISIFQEFTTITEQILRDYAYFDYAQLHTRFERLESLHCILFLNNISGKIEYIQAKEYLDREIMEFQASVLIRAAIRLISNILHEEFFETFLITAKNRGIFFRRTQYLTIVYEYIFTFPMQSQFLEWQAKKIEKICRKPGEILFTFNYLFLICDNKGSLALTNDHTRQNIPPQIAIDLLTITNTAKKIAENIYRDLIHSIFLISNQHIYGLLPMGEYSGLIQIATAPFTGYEDVYRKLRLGDRLEPVDQAAQQDLMKIITQFQTFFL